MVNAVKRNQKRMTFICPQHLRDQIEKAAENEGISMSAKIVELLSFALEFDGKTQQPLSEYSTLARKVDILEEEINDLKKYFIELEEKLGDVNFEVQNILDIRKQVDKVTVVPDKASNFT